MWWARGISRLADLARAENNAIIRTQSIISSKSTVKKLLLYPNKDVKAFVGIIEKIELRSFLNLEKISKPHLFSQLYS